MFFDALWVLINVYMVISEFREIRSVWLDHRTWRFFYNHYVKNVWNLMEWVGIMCFLYILMMYFQVVHAIAELGATWIRTCVPRRAPAARGPCYMRAAFGGDGDRALAKKTRKEEVAHARQVAETCERHSRVPNRSSGLTTSMCETRSLASTEMSRHSESWNSMLPAQMSLNWPAIESS